MAKLESWLVFHRIAPRHAEQIIRNIIHHPEIGPVISSQCGAQSDGCAYDTPSRSYEAAPDWMKALLDVHYEYMRGGSYASLISAELASDGWWWRIVQPWRYGLD